MSEATVIALIIFGGLGAALILVGWLFASLIALGQKRYAFGALCFLLPPVVAYIYCALNWGTANHAGKMLYAGTALLLICLGIFGYASFHVQPTL